MRASAAVGDVKVDTQCSGLCEDVADLRFEVGVKGRAAEAELGFPWAKPKRRG